MVAHSETEPLQLNDIPPRKHLDPPFYNKLLYSQRQFSI